MQYESREQECGGRSEDSNNNNAVALEVRSRGVTTSSGPAGPQDDVLECGVIPISMAPARPRQLDDLHEESETECDERVMIEIMKDRQTSDSPPDSAVASDSTTGTRKVDLVGGLEERVFISEPTGRFKDSSKHDEFEEEVTLHRDDKSDDAGSVEAVAQTQNPIVAVGLPQHDPEPGAYSVTPTTEPSAENVQPEMPREVPSQQGASVPGSDANASLLVATAVSDRDDLPLAVEVNMMKESRNKSTIPTRSFRIVFGVTLLIIIIVVGMATTLALVFWLREDDSAQATAKVMIIAAPSSSGTIITTRPLAPAGADRDVLALLPQYTIDTIMKDPDSAQAMAHQFLLQDPSLEDYLEWRVQQRFALATIYFSTGGPHHWLESTLWLNYSYHECDWFAKSTRGISMGYKITDFPYPCEDNPQGDYQHLWLWKNGLQGTIPPEISMLTSLRSMSIYDCPELNGSLPSTVGLLSNLVAMNLGTNNLSGSIPTEIGLLEQLRMLVLTTNHDLGGTLPTEMGQLSSLRVVVISNSRVCGTLPTQLGNLRVNLRWMILDENALMGPIPSQLGNLNAVKILDLSENELKGQMPTELGQLNNVETLELSHNNLTSTIPSQLGNLQTLAKLFLQHNNLSGSIPDQLGALAEAAEANSTSSISSSSSLTTFQIYGNDEISGTVPSALCDINQFRMECSSNLCGCECIC